MIQDSTARSLVDALNRIAAVGERFVTNYERAIDVAERTAEAGIAAMQKIEQMP